MQIGKPFALPELGSDRLAPRESVRKKPIYYDANCGSITGTIPWGIWRSMINQFLTPFSPRYYIRPPGGIIEWLIGVYCWRGLCGGYKNCSSEARLRRSQWFGFSVLLFFTFITSVFMGVSISLGSPLPLPGSNEILPLPVLMLLGAVPWMLAAGTLGTLPAVILAAISGALQAYLGNHNPYFIVETIGLAYGFSLAIRQRYRTRVFRIIRHPLVVGFLLTALLILLTPLALILMAPGRLFRGLITLYNPSWGSSLRS